MPVEFVDSPHLRHLFALSDAAWSAGIDLMERQIPTHTADTTSIRSKIMFAHAHGSKVPMSMSQARPNEVRTADQDDFKTLGMIAAEIFISRHGWDFDTTCAYVKEMVNEELAHLQPALGDPGLITFALGVAYIFLPRGDAQIEYSFGGFVTVEGDLELSTVVQMYTGTATTSQSDREVIQCMRGLGLVE